MEMKDYQKQVLEYFQKAGIVLTPLEVKNLEIADFGLRNLREEALNLVVYENNANYCAKEMVLLPNQTCPEHRHPPVKGRKGKLETFRCRYGKVYLYVEGDKSSAIQATVPEGKEDFYTAREEHILYPGDQFTISPNVLHWFQAGPKGAVISEFSTTSDDASDIFSDPSVQRV